MGGGGYGDGGGGGGFGPGGSGGGPRNKSVFTREQQAELERIFMADPYPSRETRFQLSCTLGVRESQVCNWFQNRRARGKQRGEVFGAGGVTQKE